MRTAALTLLLALHAYGQSEEDFTRLLIPVTAVAVPGANGSLWTTEWTVYNNSGDDLFIGGPFPFVNFSPMIQDNYIAARETRRFYLEEAARGFDGAFVYLPTATLDTVPMSLRVRDTSVNAQSYGTSIPVVRPSAFKPRIDLIDIPTDPSYRTMLRIYSAAEELQAVHVAVYTPAGDAPIEQYDVTLIGGPEVGFEESPRPAYAQLDVLSETVRNAGQKIRVEITAADGDEPVWAFVSISHNQTQQVTTVVP